MKTGVDWFPKLQPGPAEERLQLIERAVKLRSEIKQIFLDADHWNSCVRKPAEAPIDPDPDGELKNILAALQKFIGPLQ